MRHAFASLLALLALAACTRQTAIGSTATPTPMDRRALWLDPSHPEWRTPAPPVSHLRFETTKGVFVVELVREWGPIGADRFYNLARLGYYDDTRVHRVNRDYIAQFGLHGDPAVNAAWKEQSLRDDPPRSSNTRGTFAFAMKGPNTRTTQIYFNLADNTRNDDEPFTILGRVIEGMAVLDSLHSGYGESSGSGVRQGRQGPLEAGGNAYMDREFPLLDRILRVTVRDERFRDPSLAARDDSSGHSERQRGISAPSFVEGLVLDGREYRDSSSSLRSESTDSCLTPRPELSCREFRHTPVLSRSSPSSSWE